LVQSDIPFDHDWPKKFFFKLFCLVLFIYFFVSAAVFKLFFISFDQLPRQNSIFVLSIDNTARLLFFLIVYIFFLLFVVLFFFWFCFVLFLSFSCFDFVLIFALPKKEDIFVDP